MLPKTRIEFEKIVTAVRLLHDINVEELSFEHLDQRTYSRYVDAMQKMQQFNKLLYATLLQLDALSIKEEKDYIIAKVSENEN